MFNMALASKLRERCIEDPSYFVPTCVAVELIDEIARVQSDFNSTMDGLAEILSIHTFKQIPQDPLQFISAVVCEIKRTQKDNTRLQAVVDKQHVCIGNLIELTRHWASCSFDGDPENSDSFCAAEEMFEAAEAANKKATE